MTKGSAKPKAVEVTYTGWHFEAERRSDRGELQRYCQKCKRWFFPKWPSDRDRHKNQCAASTPGSDAR